MTYLILELYRGSPNDKAIVTTKDALGVKELIGEIFGEEATVLNYAVDRFGDGQTFLLNTLLSYRLYTSEKDYDHDTVEEVVHVITKMLKNIDFVHYARENKYGPEYFIVPAGVCERA